MTEYKNDERKLVLSRPVAELSGILKQPEQAPQTLYEIELAIMHGPNSNIEFPAKTAKHSF